MDGGEEDDCDNYSHVNPWRTLRQFLQRGPKPGLYISLSCFDTMASTDGQSLADGIEQGDNFAVIRDDDTSSEKCWIFMCGKRFVHLPRRLP